MEIKVLGPGCARCKALEKIVFNTLAELDIAASVNKVEDIKPEKFKEIINEKVDGLLIR